MERNLQVSWLFWSFAADFQVYGQRGQRRDLKGAIRNLRKLSRCFPPCFTAVILAVFLQASLRACFPTRCSHGHVL